MRTLRSKIIVSGEKKIWDRGHACATCFWKLSRTKNVIPSYNVVCVSSDANPFLSGPDTRVSAYPAPSQIRESLNFVTFLKQKADFICQQTIVNKYEHLFCLLCLWILIELCWLEASLIVPDFTFAVYGSSCNFVVSFSLLFFLYLFHGIPSCRGEAIKKNYF